MYTRNWHTLSLLLAAASSCIAQGFFDPGQFGDSPIAVPPQKGQGGSLGWNYTWFYPSGKTPTRANTDPTSPPYDSGFTTKSRYGGQPAVTSGPSVPASRVLDPCGPGATLNIQNASLDWWSTLTYTFITTTYQILFDSSDVQTGWTATPATTPFNVTSAIAQPSCTETEGTEIVDNAYNVTIVCVATPTPVAAATTVYTQIDYRPINSTSGLGPVPNPFIIPTPVATTLPDSAGVFSAGTPFVYFDSYEIVRHTPVPFANNSNGTASCLAATTTFTLPQDYAFNYYGPNPNGSVQASAGITGQVDASYLSLLNQTNATPGTWVALPTVIVVVQVTVAAFGVLAVSTTESPPPVYYSTYFSPTLTSNSITYYASSIVTIERSTAPLVGSVAPLITPSATLPSGLNFITTQPTAPGTYTLNPKGVTETSASALIVPNYTPTPAIPPVSTTTTAGRAQPDQFGQSQNIADHSVTTSGQSKGPFHPAVTTTTSNILNLGPFWSMITALAGPTPSSGGPGAIVSAIIAGMGGNPAGQNSNGGVSALGGGRIVLTLPPALTINGHTITADGLTSWIVSGKTLTPGGVITITAPPDTPETIYLDAGGSTLTEVESGHTTTSLLGSPTVTTATFSAPFLVIGGRTFPPINPTAGPTYIIAGQTLEPGSPVTVTLGTGSTYILSLIGPAATPTALEIEGLGSNGQPTTTSIESLDAVPTATSASPASGSGASKVSATGKGAKATKNAAANTKLALVDGRWSSICRTGSLAAILIVAIGMVAL